MRLRTLRPHFSASSVVCEAARIDLPGALAITWGGNKIEPYVDFAEQGGMNTASRLISPRATPAQRLGVWVRSVTQPCQPSPKGSSGRPAHRPFRGLLGVHSRYGLHTRAVTNS